MKPIMRKPKPTEPAAHYPDLLPWELEREYSRHVSAMTTGSLHSKHDIAKQLAWRDRRIALALEDGVRALAASMGYEVDDLKPIDNPYRRP